METSQQSTSRSGNDYSSTLIGTVSELRMELQRTMAEVQSVKDQNRSLLSNNQVIKDELLDTRKNYSEAYENYMATITEKLEAERQNEAFMDRLKKQLLEKTKEFDSMRDKNSPQDIDTIRIKVQEELEIPHREKMIKIQNELQEQKSRTFDIRRQYDVLKTDFGVMLKSSQREVLSLKEQYDQVERRHRDEIMRLQDREMSPEKDEQTIRAQGAQINELRHIGEKLKEDVRSMRQIKDDAVYSLQQSEARIEEVYVQLRARAAIAEAERLAIEHRLDHATAEGERKDAVIRSVKLEAEQMTYNFNDAKRQLSEVEAKLSSANIDYTSDIQNMKDSYDVELLEFEQIRSQLQDKINDREEHLRRAQLQTTTIQIRSESVEAELRKSNQLRTQELNKRLAGLEIELAEEKNSRKIAEYQSKQSAEELSAEFEVQRSELTRIMREKDVLHEKVRDLEGRYENDRKLAATYRKEATATISILEKQVKEMKVKISEFEAKILHAKSVELDHQFAAQMLKANVESLKADNAATADALKRDSLKRAADMEKTFIEKLERIKENTREALEKERKRADGYKVRAQDAQKRGKALSETALAAAASSYGMDYVTASGLK